MEDSLGEWKFFVFYSRTMGIRLPYAIFLCRFFASLAVLFSLERFFVLPHVYLPCLVLPATSPSFTLFLTSLLRLSKFFLVPPNFLVSGLLLIQYLQLSPIALLLSLSRINSTLTDIKPFSPLSRYIASGFLLFLSSPISFSYLVKKTISFKQTIRILCRSYSA